MAKPHHALKSDGPDNVGLSGPSTSTQYRVQKPAVLLVSPDGALWSEVGAATSRDVNLRQHDSIAELCQTTPTGQSGIIIWDTREEADRSVSLTRLQQHSPRFATIVIDQSARKDFWKPLLQQGQIVSLLSVPIDAAQLSTALVQAQELLQPNAKPALEVFIAPQGTGAGSKRSWMLLTAGAVLAVAVGAYYWSQHRTAEPAAEPPLSAGSTDAAPAPPSSPSASDAKIAAQNVATPDDKVDALLERARLAMQERHFMEPADGNALSLYRDVLSFDPANGEAQQGLQRIAQILIARVQTDLEERKFDLALQALETARSISPEDPRFGPLDARIASMRAELGPAQIQAAINAKNFDKAQQLLDDATRAKALGGGSLNQLRDELNRRRTESNVANYVKLVETRMQQDRLIDPPEDSATYYLQKARGAGAAADQLQLQSQELNTRLLAAARVAIDQHRYVEAERLLTEAVNAGAQAGVVAALQRDLTAGQSQQAKEKSNQTALFEFAQTRLNQGSLLEPDNDNALYYLNQLRAANPKYSGLATLAQNVQSQLTARARTALDSGDNATATTLLARAAELGTTADVTALQARLAQAPASAPAATAVAGSSLIVVKRGTMEYPKNAAADGTEGWVSLSFVVDAAGKVTNIQVLDASPPRIFNAAATTALAHTRYQPVVQNGKPVEVPAKLRLIFKLDKK